jgi:hypothetical protein
MNSTPHDDDRPKPRDGLWHSEYLPDGTQRHWSDRARAYSEPDDDRERLAEAITGTRWYRLDEPLPMSHGDMLRELATTAGLRPVAFGISDLPLEFPEPAYLESDRETLEPDWFETLTVVAIAAVFGRTVFMTYLLDRGYEVDPLALELRERAGAPNRTLACDAGFDQLCRGHFRGNDGDQPCQCACHAPDSSRSTMPTE